MNFEFRLRPAELVIRILIIGAALVGCAGDPGAPREAGPVDQCAADAGRACDLFSPGWVERCTFDGTRLVWGVCGPP